MPLAFARALPLALALLLPLAAASRADDEPQPTLTVTGTGEVSVVPDAVSISVGVLTEDASAAEALAKNSAAMQAVLDLVAAEGLGPRDVRTDQVSLNPVWTHDERENRSRITGYQAQNLVSIRLREIGRLGALLDRIARGGANTINGIAFESTEARASLDAARRAAVADARRIAELYAEAAGVRLGRVLSITEGGPYTPAPMPAERAAALPAPVPVAAGERTLGVSVTVVWRLQ